VIERGFGPRGAGQEVQGSIPRKDSDPEKNMVQDSDPWKIDSWKIDSWKIDSWKIDPVKIP